MENYKIHVYIMVDENNSIIDVASSIQDMDFTDWIKIDEGMGEKYAHAQNYYFSEDKPLRDNQGRCNYKYEDNEVVELTDEEKKSLFPTQVQQPTEQQILNAKLLQDNANMQLELEQQKQLNAQILLQIAGGVTNA